VQEADTPSDAVPLRTFVPLRKPAGLYELAEPLDVLRHQHRVVQELFMALVAEDVGLPFVVPGTYD
jgi:hypothetical protein